MPDKLKLAHGTTEQKEAAFKVVFPKILDLARFYAKQVNVPFVNVEQMAIAKLTSPEAKAQMMEIIDAAIDAAEQVEHPNG